MRFMVMFTCKCPKEAWGWNDTDMVPSRYVVYGTKPELQSRD
jgi:hypothetical protein